MGELIEACFGCRCLLTLRSIYGGGPGSGYRPASGGRRRGLEEHVRTLLKLMLEADQLVVQTTPYNESPVTAVFDIRGLDVVLPELAETCTGALEGLRGPCSAGPWSTAPSAFQNRCERLLSKERPRHNA